MIWFALSIIPLMLMNRRKHGNFFALIAAVDIIVSGCLLASLVLGVEEISLIPKFCDQFTQAPLPEGNVSELFKFMSQFRTCEKAPCWYDTCTEFVTARVCTISTL